MMYVVFPTVFFRPADLANVVVPLYCLFALGVPILAVKRLKTPPPTWAVLATKSA